MVKSLKTLQTDSASVSASNNPLKAAGVTDVSFAPQVSTFWSLAGTIKWAGGVLAPNGKIYGIPHNSTTILEIDTGSCYEPCDWALSPLVNKL